MTYTVSSGTLNPCIPYHTIPYHTTPCLFPVLDSQPTATELFQSLPFGFGTVFRSTSHPRRHFPSSALAWRHTSSNCIIHKTFVVPTKWRRHFGHVNRFTYLLTYLLTMLWLIATNKMCLYYIISLIVFLIYRFLTFLSRVSMRYHTERDIVVPFLSVCLSVRWSRCGIMSKWMHILYISPVFLTIW